MKLYATIKNNRGGKKSTSDDTKITVELTYKNTVIGMVGLYAIIDDELEGYRIIFDNGQGWSGSQTIKEVALPKTKGKRQKGECKHFIVKDDYGKEYCQECGQYNNLK